MAVCFDAVAVGIACRLQCVAEVDVVIGGGGISAQSLAGSARSTGSGSPSLHPVTMPSRQKGIGIIWLLRQHSAIEQLCFGKSARFMVLNGGMDNLVDAHVVISWGVTGRIQKAGQYSSSDFSQSVLALHFTAPSRAARRWSACSYLRRSSSDSGRTGPISAGCRSSSTATNVK